MSRALHFVVPVWGEMYVSTYLSYALPSQLASGNLGNVPADAVSSYVICTTRHDYERIRSDAAFQTLSRLVAVDVEYLDDELKGGKAQLPGAKYDVKSDCYRRALRRAAAKGDAVVALNADIVMANGFVRTVRRLLAEGKRVIEIPGPRALLEPTGAALRQAYRGADGISISIEPVDLSALWLKNIHPLLEMHFVEGPTGEAFHPSHLYWRVDEEGIVMRGFHLYPIVVVPDDTPINFRTTIDDDLVANMGVSAEKIFLASDSREMFCCELSHADASVGRIASRGQIDRYVDFYCAYATTNLQNLRKEILIAGVPVLGPTWRSRREESERFVGTLFRHHRRALVRRSVRAAGNAVRAALPSAVKTVLRKAKAKIRGSST